MFIQITTHTVQLKTSIKLSLIHHQQGLRARRHWVPTQFVVGVCIKKLALSVKQGGPVLNYICLMNVSDSCILDC